MGAAVFQPRPAVPQRHAAAQPRLGSGTLAVPPRPGTGNYPYKAVSYRYGYRFFLLKRYRGGGMIALKVKINRGRPLALRRFEAALIFWAGSHF